VYEYRSPFTVISWPERGGKSSYYSSNCTEKDAKFVLEFLQSIKMIVENTFLVKVSDNYYIVLVVSSAYNKPNQPSVYQQYKGATIEIQYGFLGSIMNEVVDHMKGANNHTANNNQYNMIKEYVGTFSDGDMEKHKESQRWWIQDKGPIIETNIGFVETYLDAQGVRAEWEGMVAIVDKERSKLLAKLVELAEEINTELPWPNDYEKDTFLRPDFTDLAVLTFAGSGTPIGINIPNYDDIRMNFGFKNVNLGNVAGTMKKESLICMSDQYKDIIVPNHSLGNFVFEVPYTIYPAATCLFPGCKKSLIVTGDPSGVILR